VLRLGLVRIRRARARCEPGGGAFCLVFQVGVGNPGLRRFTLATGGPDPWPRPVPAALPRQSGLTGWPVGDPLAAGGPGLVPHRGESGLAGFGRRRESAEPNRVHPLLVAQLVRPINRPERHANHPAMRPSPSKSNCIPAGTSPRPASPRWPYFTRNATALKYPNQIEGRNLASTKVPAIMCKRAAIALDKDLPMSRNLGWRFQLAMFEAGSPRTLLQTHHPWRRHLLLGLSCLLPSPCLPQPVGRTSDSKSDSVGDH